MIGLVLAAGAGSRLAAHTRGLPKTLVPLTAETDDADDGPADRAGRRGGSSAGGTSGAAGPLTPLDTILAAFAAVGVIDVAVVVGHAREAIEGRAAALEDRHGVALSFVGNDRPAYNNCYSLWCARELFTAGVLLANGDTVHPAAVERALLAGRGPDVLLAVDTHKVLGAEEMKVRFAGDRLERISKEIPPQHADGEYIGVALLEAAAAGPLADALAATWQRDPRLYYEDGFQTLADRGAHVGGCPIGDVAWTEVDDAADLARARALVAAGRLGLGGAAHRSDAAELAEPAGPAGVRRDGGR